MKRTVFGFLEILGGETASAGAFLGNWEPDIENSFSLMDQQSMADRLEWRFLLDMPS